MTILDEIAGKTRIRIAEQKKKLPLEAVRKQAEALRSETGFPSNRHWKVRSLFYL